MTEPLIQSWSKFATVLPHSHNIERLPTDLSTLNWELYLLTKKHFSVLHRPLNPVPHVTLVFFGPKANQFPARSDHFAHSAPKRRFVSGRFASETTALLNSLQPGELIEHSVFRHNHHITFTEQDIASWILSAFEFSKVKLKQRVPAPDFSMNLYSSLLSEGT